MTSGLCLKEKKLSTYGVIGLKLMHFRIKMTQIN